MQEPCLGAGKKLVRFNSRPRGQGSETPRRNEARRQVLIRPYVYLEVMVQCLFFGVHVNCSGLDAEGKSAGGGQ